MEETQNTNEERQPGEVIPIEAHEDSGHATPERSIPASAEVKEETPVPLTQPQTTNQPQTDSMEVHKHPHHVMHSKKWNEYLLEFFMLFLAVFLGFVAENIREHLIDTRHERQYINSLYDDLRSDTAEVKKTISEKTWVISKLDSLKQILASPVIAGQNEELYYLERFLTKNEMFNAQDVTYQQLKSSGSFRYISNLALYKKLSDYYKLYNRYQSLIESQFENSNSLTAMEASLFNGNDLDALNNNSQKSFYDLFKRPATKLHPVMLDSKSLNFLTVKVGNALLLQQTCILFLNSIDRNASALIADLKKEYHLENK